MPHSFVHILAQGGFLEAINTLEGTVFDLFHAK